MLTESFVAATSSPPTKTSANFALIKDAGIFFHTFQPRPCLKSTFKKSAVGPNCLALNDSHVFAAQAGKAVVHVYSREKGNQEAIISFPERIHSLALTTDGNTLALGTEGGAVIIWETCTGRQITTSESHLQPVSLLAVDLKSNFLLSASKDSTILVWSLLDLLSFSTSSVVDSDSRSPRRSLTSHQAAITGLTLGHSASTANIAVSASQDKTGIVWNYHTGEQLRTFLLFSAPSCLLLDPADRCCFAGYEDGRIQKIDFYDPRSITSEAHDIEKASLPVQPPSTSRWSRPPVAEQEVDPIKCLSLSYDASRLLSGHGSGKINSWNAGSGQFESTVAEYAGAPITNLQFLEPTGFIDVNLALIKSAAIVKPRPHEEFSGPQGGSLNGAYKLHSRLSQKPWQEDMSFQQELLGPGFSAELLAESLIEFEELAALPKGARGQVAADIDIDADFMALDDTDPLELDAKVEIDSLRIQVEHLKSLQSISIQKIGQLADANEVLNAKQVKVEEKELQKLKRRNEKSDAEWDALGARQRKAVAARKQDEEGDVHMNGSTHDVEDEDSSMTTSSIEYSSGQE